MTSDNDTITLADAAHHYNYSIWTLRAEAGRGRLTVYKIGKRLYTTPADIREMVSKCRVDQKAPASTSTRSASNGLSEMERASSAQAAAQETILRLRSGSRNTSATNGALPLRRRP